MSTIERATDLEAESKADFHVAFTLAEDGTWLAELVEIPGYGSGPSIGEALHDLLISLVEAREMLSELRDELAPNLADELAYLESMHSLDHAAPRLDTHAVH